MGYDATSPTLAAMHPIYFAFKLRFAAENAVRSQDEKIRTHEASLYFWPISTSVHGSATFTLVPDIWSDQK